MHFSQALLAITTDASQGLPAATAIVAVFLAALAMVLVAAGSRWLLRHEQRFWAAARAIRPNLTRRGPVRWISTRYPRAWTFLRSRFTPGEYLGLHLTIGIVASAIGISIFGRVLHSVLGEEGLTRFDEALADVIHAYATPSGAAFWSVVSWFGTYPVMCAIGLTFGILLFRRGERLFLLTFGIGILGAHYLNQGLKLAVHRQRPVFDVRYAVESTFSFPSGHSLGSAVGYGLIAYATWQLLEKRYARVCAVLLAGVFVLAIGYSRMYLGVHYFSDVIAGFSVGGAWLAVCITGLVVTRHRTALRRRA